MTPHQRPIAKQNFLPHLLFLLAFIFFLPMFSFAQVEQKEVPDGTEGIVHVIPEIDSSTGKATNLPPNEINTSFSTFKVGLGFIYDVVAYAQDDVFQQQMDSLNTELEAVGKLRDFRILASGLLKTKRELSWKFAFMYDGANDEWLVRESGIIIGVPEIAGRIFIGRTKEGYSMVKVMNGHSPWTMERQMAIDIIPIIADGIKYFGFLPKSRIFLNLGYFNDFMSKGQGFSTFEWQYVARVGWLPFYDKENNSLVHVAANFQYSKPLDGEFRARSRPESNPSPYIIDTGKFPAEHSYHIGGEIYYNRGRFMIGSEIAQHKFMSVAGDHTFTGGDIVTSYFLTKTKRPYKTDGSIFGFVKVNNPLFKGGLGEWEAVLHVSTLNLNDGDVHGGKFWRITPMINWYMTRSLRTEFAYGYGQLDRFGLQGNVSLFQARFQLTVM
jgi:phosphate-selective porin OprO/OprP